MSRLRVLFLAADYPTLEQPSHALYVRQLARAAALQHEVVVVHGPRPGRGMSWRLEKRRDAASRDGIATFDLFFGASPIPKTAWLMRLHAAARAHEGLLRHGFVPTLVHANHFRAALAGSVIAKLAGAPMVLSESAPEIPRRLLTPAELLEVRVGYPGAAIVMPVSTAVLDGINGYGLFPRCRIVPKAVDSELFCPAPGVAPVAREAAQLLFVGELVPVKGVDTLLEACARLQRRRHDWRLEVVGDGPGRQAHERLAEELGLGRHVSFTGEIPQVEVARRMRRADALVLPSLWENLPSAGVEAACCGLPVVGCRVGGVQEAIGPEDGVLCEARDPGALAAAMDEMLTRRGAFDREQISARATARFGRAVVAVQLDQVYAEARAARTRSSPPA